MMVTDSQNTTDNFFKSPNNQQISDDEMGDSEDDLERMDEDQIEDILFLENDKTDY
jgi:hypothetical protein